MCYICVYASHCKKLGKCKIDNSLYGSLYQKVNKDNDEKKSEFDDIYSVMS
jgi:hypothetical protein